MKKVFSNHAELAHIWAQQEQESGRGANMFFEGARIYSYGHHFCIANFIDPDCVLFTTRTYSTTTAGHKSIARQAVSHKIVFEVPSIGENSIDAPDHGVNVQHFLDLIQEERGAALRAHKHGQHHLNAAGSAAAQVNAYIEHFGIDQDPIDAAGIFTNEERAKLAAKAAGASKRDQERQERARIKEAADLEAWAAGLDTHGRNFWNSPIKLRVKLPFGEKRAIVETSRGARVTCIEAARFLAVMDSGADISGQRIGDYTADSRRDDLLIIGCHEIEQAEIDRIRPAINEEVRGLCIK